MESSCCKLTIFQYKNIDTYQNILYVDTDVLVNSDVNVLFSIDISPEKLYALEEGNIGHEYWGAQFFDFSKLNRNTAAFSAGVFYFMNSVSMKTLFDDTNRQIANYLHEKRPIPICLDQPFLVYNAVVQNKYDNQCMKQYVENNPTVHSKEKILYHFPGDPGHYASKIQKMTAFWEKMKMKMKTKRLSPGFRNFRKR
jgi:lipopolysaccharide biosynthesis glycosyltransferase